MWTNTKILRIQKSKFLLVTSMLLVCVPIYIKLNRHGAAASNMCELDYWRSTNRSCWHPRRISLAKMNTIGFAQVKRNTLKWTDKMVWYQKEDWKRNVNGHKCQSKEKRELCNMFRIALGKRSAEIYTFVNFKFEWYLIICCLMIVYF